MKAILWLLLHAITVNNKEHQYELDQAQIISLFHRFTAVVVVAADFHEDLDKLERRGKKINQSNNKRAPKNKKKNCR